MANTNIAPNGPPPDYGSTVETHQPMGIPQPGMQAPTAQPDGPPPKYEPSSGAPPQQSFPPQPGYPGGVNQRTVIVQSHTYGPYSVMTECPYCHATVTTHVNYISGTLTWLTAGMLCLFGCWLGCCLIPFCVPDLQDAEHSCPNCNHTISIYRRL